MKKGLSVNDVLNIKNDCFPFDGRWMDAFAQPERTGVWFVYGKSSAGKSRFILQLAKYLANWEKSVYNSLEERFSMSLQNALVDECMKDVNGSIVFVKEDIAELSERLAKRHSPRVVFIDSFQHSLLSYKQYLEFRKRHENKLIVFISHVEGKNPAGRAACEVMYDADQKIYVEGYKAFSKGRFMGEVGEYTIWEKGAKEYWSNF